MRLKKNVSRSGRLATLSLAAASGLVFVGTDAAKAASSTYNVNANGNWSTTGNWTGSTPADGADFTATFAADINLGRTVSLDSDRTIGGLTFQDITTPTNNWTLASTGTP